MAAFGLASGAILLNARPVLATPGAAGPAIVAWVPSGFSPPLPTDGSVGFSYERDASVTGCEQGTEAEIRDLLIGVVHTDPFAPAGTSPAFKLKVSVARGTSGAVRASFALLDASGAQRGSSAVEDATCDGAHLKLLASIALLLQPRPDATCAAACREDLEKKAAERARAELYAREVPLVQQVARAIGFREAEEGRQRSFRAVVGAGATLGLNVAADPAPGFWLSAEARSPRWSFGLEMRTTPPSRTLQLAGGAELTQLTTSGIFAPCWRLWWFSGCGLIEAGGAWVTGAPGGARSSTLLGFGLRVRWDAPIASGFEARLFGDLTGYPVTLDDRVTGAAGSVSFQAPRRAAVFLGLGIARVFD